MRNGTPQITFMAPYGGKWRHFANNLNINNFQFVKKSKTRCFYILNRKYIMTGKYIMSFGQVVIKILNFIQFSINSKS